MGFAYKGDHKGSTVKARSKNAARSLLHIVLAVVLVFGLAPGLSFAGEAARATLDANDVPADSSSSSSTEDGEDTADGTDASDGSTGESSASEDDDPDESGSSVSDVDGDDEGESEGAAEDESVDSEEEPDVSAGSDESDVDGSDADEVGDSGEEGDGADEPSDDSAIANDQDEGLAEEPSGDDEGQQADGSKESPEDATASDDSEAAGDAGDEGVADEGIEAVEADETALAGKTGEIDENDGVMDGTADDDADAVDDELGADDGEGSLAVSKDEGFAEDGDADETVADRAIEKVREKSSAKKASTAPRRVAQAGPGALTVKYQPDAEGENKVNTVDGVDYYKPVTKTAEGKYYIEFKVEFLDSEFEKPDDSDPDSDPDNKSKVEVLLENGLDSNGTTKSISVDPVEGDDGKWSGTFKVFESEALIPTTITVIETNKDGESTEVTYGEADASTKVVVDATAPSNVDVSWSVPEDEGDGVIGTKSDDELSYLVGEGVTSVSAIATITVEDYNLSCPESALEASDDNDKTAVSVKGDSLDASVVSNWEAVDATSSSPAQYTCKIKITTTADLSSVSEFAPEVTVTPRDCSGNEPDEATVSVSAIKVTADKEPPVFTVKKGESPIDNGGKAYFKTGDSVEVVVTEPHPADPDTLKGEIGEEELTFSAPDESHQRKAAVEFGTEGSDANTTYVTDGGELALTLKDTDALGNEGKYSATFNYDTADPTITVEYGEDKGDDTSYSELKDPSGDVYFKANQKVKVTLADTMGDGGEYTTEDTLDVDNSSVACTLTKASGSSTSDPVVKQDEEKIGVYYVDLSAATDGDKYTLKVTAKDKAGNGSASPYEATFEVYTFEPELGIVWEQDSPKEGIAGGSLGNNMFYSSRKATITITDRHFDAEQVTLKYDEGGKPVTGDDDKVKWTEGDTETEGVKNYTAVVDYTNNAKDCFLSVDYMTSVGTPAKAADESTKVEGGAYSSGNFDVIASPVMDVEFPMEPGEPVGGTPYFVLDNDGTFVVTVTVADPLFAEHKEAFGFSAITDKCDPDTAVKVSEEWSPADDSALVHTRTITYSKDCDVETFVITAPEGYVGSEGAENLWEVGGGKTSLSLEEGSTKYEYASFAIDNTPPKLVSIAYDPDDPVTSASEDNGFVRYFNHGTTAAVEVNEKHLGNNGEDVTVKLGENQIDQDKWNAIDMPMVAGGEKEYVLTISGKDLAGNALVKDSSDASTVGSDGTYTSTVVVDNKNPVLTVSYDKGKACDERDGGVRYCNDTVTATVTVTDRYLGDGVIIEDIMNGDIVHSYKFDAGDHKVTISKSETGEHTLKVSGADLAGNKLVAASDSGIVVDDNGVYEQKIRIDTSKPQLMVAMDPDKADKDPRMVEGVPTYYFNTPVKLTGSVEDDVHLMKEGITTTVTPGLPDVKSPSAHGTLAENIFGEDGFTIGSDSGATDEAAYTVEVKGTDAAGNKLVAANKSDNRAADSGAVKDGSYESTIVYDKTAPVVEVKYGTSKKASEADKKLANGAKKQSGENLYAFVVVTEALSFDADEIDISTTGVVDKTGSSVKWDKSGNTYTATVYFQADDAKDEAYTLKVSGKDRAGNAMQEYRGTFDIDKYSPRVKVEFNKDPNGMTGERTKDETRYYNAAKSPVTVTVTVEELNNEIDFSKNRITFADDKGATATAFTLKEQRGKTYVYQATMRITAPNAGDVTHTLALSGSDEVGNKIVARDASTFVNNGRYNAKVVLDTTLPKVSVTYGGKALKYGATGQEAFTSDKVVVKATLTDAIRFKDDLDKTYTLKVNGSRVYPSDAALSDDKKKVTFSFELAAEQARTKSYDISIQATDMAGNQLAGDPGQPNSGVAYSAQVSVDQETPKLAVSYVKADQGTVENVKNRATATERRYYGDDVTARLVVTEVHFSPENIVVNGKRTAESDWTNAGAIHVYLKPYTAEAASRLTVCGSDAANNEMESANGSTFMSMIDNRNTYVSTVIVDKTAPTVEVTYGTSADARAASGTLPNGDRRQSGTDLYAFVTVTDKLSFNEGYMDDTYRIDVSQEQRIQKTDGKIWTDNGNGTYTAVLLFTAEADQDVIYPFMAWGSDLAGNKLATYGGTLDIDKHAPRMSISFDKAPGDITDQGGAEETRYYSAGNSPVTATVTVEELNNEIDFSKNWVVFEDDRGSEPIQFSLKSQDGTSKYVYEAKLTMEAPVDGDEVHSLTVRGTDQVGNRIVSADEKGDESVAPRVRNGRYESKVDFDITQPTLTVTWNDASAKNGKYYKADRVATVQVTEANFRADQVSVKQNDTELNTVGEWALGSSGDEWYDASGDSDKTWTRSASGDVWTFSVQPSYTESDNDQHLVVTAVDRAKNNLSDSVSDSSRPVATQSPTCSEGTYTSAGFVIDETSPVINVALNRDVKDTLKNVNYFNDQVVATVVVEEKHFGTDNADYTTTVEGSGGSESAGWKKTEAGNVWQYKMSYGENADASTPNTLNATVYDYAGNSAKYAYGAANTKAKESDLPDKSKGFLVDMTAPTVQPLSGANIPTNDYSGKYGADEGDLIFLNKQTQMRIRLADNIGLYTANLGNADTLYRIENDVNPGEGTKDVIVGLEDGKEFTDDIKLVCEDVAKNVRIWSISPTGEVTDVTGSSAENTPLYGSESNLYPKRVIQDTVAPRLTLSGVTANEFYNADQTVKLDVEELNFRYLKRYDPSQVIMTIDKQSGDASLSSSSRTVSVSNIEAVNEMTGAYAHTEPFAEDGHYTVRAVVTDPAKNVSNSVSIENFTIDKTAPTVQVAWDNNDSRNGNYYKAGRTATITVTEHNFDAALMTITTAGSIGGWSSSGDVHTCTVSCQSDGRYSLQVTGSDKAGNALAAYNEPEFVVDLISPTITFSSVDNETAYNDNIAPVIEYADEANFNSGAMEYTLNGSKNGPRAMAASQGSSGNSGTVTFADFAREVESDDIWTLHAHVADMAGNEAEGQIMFSVNRFGSNFMVEDAEQYANGYLDEAREVRVREINVSGVDTENHGVTVTHGLTTENLERQAAANPSSSKGYYIDSGSENSGWSSYTYHIGADNFPDDGNYHVVVNSKDIAQNLNNSANYYDPDEHKTSDAEVSFILDTVAPIIDSLSISPGGTYDAGEKSVTFNVIDNIGCDKVDVTLDGELLSQDDVALDASGLCMVNVPAVAFKARDMQIVATDRAGHTAEESVLGFHMTTNPLELHLPIVAGGVAVVVAAAVGGVVFIRRRRGL